MLGLMGFSGSLPLYVIHRYYIFVFIDRANKDACLLVRTDSLYTVSGNAFIVGQTIYKQDDRARNDVDDVTCTADLQRPISDRM